MIIWTLLTTAIVAFLVWSRMAARIAAMEAIVAELTERVQGLERWRTTAPSVSAQATPVVPVAKPPAQPLPVPTLPPVLTRPLAPPPPAALPPRVPVPPSSVETPRSVEAPQRATARDALETRIGSRWLLYVGVVAIVVGVAYFEKLAIDNHWVSETTRVIQGAVAGLLLVAGGLQFVRKGYRLYGQILSGSGVAILYVSTYAAFNFYHLIDQTAAFGLMTGVTTLAAWLADRQRSQGLALVAVGGGFATPFLLPASTDAEVALFGYDTFLIAGTMFLSRRRDWPTLNVVSYGFTVLTFLAWAARFYTPSKYLTTELFLTVFCGMFLYILREVRQSDHPSAGAERSVLWTAPFGYYLLSVAILADHSPALLIYLVLLSLVGVLVSVRAGSPARLAFWCAAAAPLLLWSEDHGGSAWLAGGLAAWAAVFVLNLAGLLEATLRKERRFAAADIALLHANGLGSYAGAYLLIEAVRTSANAPLAAALALVNAAIGGLIAKRSRDEALHFAALAFTLLTIAVGLQLEGAWVTSAWAAEGAVVVWLGLRERREWLRAGGLWLFGVALIRLLVLLFSPPPVGQLPVLNQRAACGVFLIVLTYAMTFAHRPRSERPGSGLEVGIGLLAAKLLLLAVAASEILAYWSLHPVPPFEPDAQVVGAALIVGAVIMWIGLRRREEWFRAVGGSVVAIAAVSILTAQLRAAPIGYVPVLNARAGAGVCAVLVLYALAVIHRRIGEHVADLRVNIAILTTSASLLTLSLLTSEIDAFWAARGAADVWSIAREGLQAIVWGAIGGFLIWHGLANRRGWVRVVGGALLTVGILRLLRLQFTDAAPTYVVVANARVVASIVMIVLLYGLAGLFRTADIPERPYAPATVLWLLANALTLTLLTSEITAYWHVHDVRSVTANASATSHFAREMMLSITWAVYAMVLVVVGLRRQYAPIRYFAMIVFVVTIVKVFAIDLAELDRLYRVLSVIGLGVTLLLTSYLYQKVTTESSRRDQA
jgi:hypothetical protein